MKIVKEWVGQTTNTEYNDKDIDIDSVEMISKKSFQKSAYTSNPETADNYKRFIIHSYIKLLNSHTTYGGTYIHGFRRNRSLTEGNKSAFQHASIQRYNSKKKIQQIHS